MFRFDADQQGNLTPTVDQERRRIFLKGARRSQFIAGLMMSYLCYYLAPVTGESFAWAWAIFINLLFVVRYIFFEWVLRQPEPFVNDRRVDWFVAASGALVALPCTYVMLRWFPVMKDVDRAVVTVIYVGWIAGGIAAQASYPRWAPYWSFPLMLGVVLSWASLGGLVGWGLAGLAIILTLVMIGGLLISADSIKESIHNKLINRRLIDELLAQRALVEDSVKAKTAFLVAAGHDLRQPAMGLGLLISAMQSAPDIATARTIAERANKPLGAMERILQSLLEFSRLDSGQVVVKAAPFDLDEMLNSLAEETRALLNDDVSLEVDSLVGKIHADAILFEQVIRNLLSNAARFTLKGTIRLSSSFLGNLVQVQVSDTGVGIASEAQPTIFDEYVQANNAKRSRSQGLGLGLSIVKKASKLLGATIEFESTVGVGSRFVFRAPAQVLSVPASGVGTALDGADTANPPLIDRAVLMVDDDPLVRESFQTAVELFGNRVLSCASPEAAILALEQSAAPVKIAFVDHQISDDCSGLELIGAIRARWPAVRCVLVTGDASKETADLALRANVEVMYKPLRVQKIIELIGQ